MYVIKIKNFIYVINSMTELKCHHTIRVSQYHLQTVHWTLLNFFFYRLNNFMAEQGFFILLTEYSGN